MTYTKDGIKGVPIYRAYLFPVMAQTILAGGLAYFLRANGYECSYQTWPGMALIAIAGTSSAVWGCICQTARFGKKPSEILSDFFDVRASLQSYCLVIIFLFLDFLDVIISGTVTAAKPGILALLFLKSILFGGIEETGWRYTFQPALEKRSGAALASLETFLWWGLWHLLFFYTDGSMADVKIIPFMAGLFTNCFMLSAIYRYSNSLWLCVMTHALINTFSQTAGGGNALIGAAAKAVIVITAILLGSQKNKA